MGIFLKGRTIFFRQIEFMIIAGAGGHGNEVAFVLQSLGFSTLELFFFDQDKSKSSDLNEIKNLILDENVLVEKLEKRPEFVLGVGNPLFREKLYTYFISLGGSYFGINCVTYPMGSSKKLHFDAMPYCFIGPNTKIGIGALINTRAHVHHDSEVGRFSEIGPGAILLGGSKVGDKCSIGAGAVILPGVKLDDEVIVGAGAVVTKSFGKKNVLVGIPAKSKHQGF